MSAIGLPCKLFQDNVIHEKKKAFYLHRQRNVCMDWMLFYTLLRENNRPGLIYTYLYSDMATRLSVQNSIFGVVFFVSMSFSGIVKQKKLKTKYNFDPKALFHVFSLSVIRFVQDLQCKCPGFLQELTRRINQFLFN